MAKRRNAVRVYVRSFMTMIRDQYFPFAKRLDAAVSFPFFLARLVNFRQRPSLAASMVDF
jgi:hypothetical protein